MIEPAKIPLPEPILETIEQVIAFEIIPLLQQFPYTDSYNLIMSSARRFAADTALEFLLQGLPEEATQRTSYTDLGVQITRTANLLHRLGIAPNDAVSIILPILPQTHFAIWGAQAAGIANPINPMLEAEHIGEIIAASGSKIVICLAPSVHSNIWEKVLAAVKEYSIVETIIAVDVNGLTQTANTGLSNKLVTVLDFDASIAQESGTSLNSGRQFAADQIAAYFHTGGTTGRPKLAQLTHGNMAFLGQLMQVYTAHMTYHTVLCGLPLFHIYGVIVQGVAAFSVGYRIILMTPSGFRSPIAMKNFWQHIDRFQVQQFSAVPTVLMALADIPVGDADISSLTDINSGAAPLSLPFELNFEKKFQVEVGNGYGMTETTALISRAPAQQPPGSVGMRIPYSQIRIAQLDGVKVVKNCALGKSGVILVKGPQVFVGYKSGADNAKAWIEDDWFNTGDLGYLDAEGFLYLSGRAKDLIIRSGHNIDPELIEEPLCAHPAVSAAVAIGMPDPFAGELPMAFVVRKPGVEIDSKMLLQYCAEEISERAAIPKRIEFIESMPLTAVGKIFKPALRQRITQQIVSEHLEQAGIKAQVNVMLEKKRGIVAMIEAVDKSQIESVKELLQSYTFAVEVS